MVRHIAMPSSHNIRVLDAMRAAGADLPPASVVPHVCRGALQPVPPSRLEALARWAGIGPGDTVFYTINAWDPRKRMAQLVDGFARAFTRDDAAILVIKTCRTALFDDPAGPPGTRDVAAIFQAIVARAESETGRPPARIALLAEDEVPDSLIDGIHTLGHCFVSLSRCEGFGLGMFDAATRGRPVIAVGYGGPTDFLGTDWPGRVPHRMVPCESIAGYQWFDPTQSWPEPDDLAAFALMRDFIASPEPFRAAAETIRRRILEEFGPRAVSARLSAAITQASGRPPTPLLAVRW
jgi:glycosyltransferase involved in cell wall biosynthesis